MLRLKAQLGQKYEDYHPMVQRLKEKLARLAQMCADSVELPIQLAHLYTYSNWDMVHEPDNVADNVLTADSATQWKTLSPSINLALAGGSAACFVGCMIGSIVFLSLLGMPPIDLADNAKLALLATVVEAVSPPDVDNFLMPLAVWWAYRA